MIGGIAITMSATRTGQIESGSIRKTRITTPSVGSARQKLLTRVGGEAAAARVADQQPERERDQRGDDTPSAEYQMCSISRAGMPSGPDHCSEP